MSRFRPRLTYANVIASLALFAALGGTGVASQGVRAVKSAITGKQVKDHSLTAKDIRAGSLTTKEIKNGSLLGADFRAGQLSPGPRGPQGPTGPTGATGTVDTSNFYDKATSDGRFLEARTVDYDDVAGSVARGYDVGAAHLNVSCSTSGGASLIITASAGTATTASGTWTNSDFGGGSTSPVAGQYALTSTAQNFLSTAPDKQIDGTFVFRTPGKVVSLIFHGAAVSSGARCEFHATVVEPRGAAPLG